MGWPGDLAGTVWAHPYAALGTSKYFSLVYVSRKYSNVRVVFRVDKGISLKSANTFRDIAKVLIRAAGMSSSDKHTRP